MCGVWAAINVVGGSHANQLQFHRGPDDSGCQRFEIGRSVVELAHRRLAIIDLDERAAQPMQFVNREGQQYWLTYNGEIYNYVELSDELKALGYAFQTQSDSEVLIAAVDAWGTQALTRFVGMFAFALLCVNARRMLIARDPFGIKPLYVMTGANEFAMSSEIKPLLWARNRTSSGQQAPHPGTLFRYLRFGITDDGSSTMFDGVEQLPSSAFCLD